MNTLKSTIKTLILSSLLLILLSPFIAYAGTLEFAPQVDIPTIDYDKVQPGGDTRAIGEYIKGVYSYGIGIVAIVATVVMMFGGFQWIIAGGSAEKVGEAKTWIGASLTGLVLALGSFMILNIVSPDLTSFNITTIRPIVKIEKMGCCTKLDSVTGIVVECTNTKGEALCKQKYPGLGAFKENYECINNECVVKDKGCCLYKKNSDGDWGECESSLYRDECEIYPDSEWKVGWSTKCYRVGWAGKLECR